MQPSPMQPSHPMQPPPLRPPPPPADPFAISTDSDHATEGIIGASLAGSIALLALTCAWLVRKRGRKVSLDAIPRLVRQWRQRVLHKLIRQLNLWRWHLGTWHLVDTRTMYLMCALQAVMGVVVMVHAFDVLATGDVEELTTTGYLGSAFTWITLAEVSLTHVAVGLESPLDLIAATLLSAIAGVLALAERSHFSDSKAVPRWAPIAVTCFASVFVLVSIKVLRGFGWRARMIFGSDNRTLLLYRRLLQFRSLLRCDAIGVPLLVGTIAALWIVLDGAMHAELAVAVVAIIAHAAVNVSLRFASSPEREHVTLTLCLALLSVVPLAALLALSVGAATRQLKQPVGTALALFHAHQLAVVALCVALRLLLGLMSVYVALTVYGRGSQSIDGRILPEDCNQLPEEQKRAVRVFLRRAARGQRVELRMSRQDDPTGFGVGARVMRAFLTYNSELQLLRWGISADCVIGLDAIQRVFLHGVKRRSTIGPHCRPHAGTGSNPGQGGRNTNAGSNPGHGSRNTNTGSRNTSPANGRSSRNPSPGSRRSSRPPGLGAAQMSSTPSYLRDEDSSNTSFGMLAFGTMNFGSVSKTLAAIWQAPWNALTEQALSPVMQTQYIELIIRYRRFNESCTLTITSKRERTVKLFHAALQALLYAHRASRPPFLLEQVEWIRNVFESVDKHHLGFLSSSKVPVLVSAANALFSKVQHDRREGIVTISKFQHIISGLITSQSTAISQLFDQYATDGLMTRQKWMQFCREKQGPTEDLADASLRFDQLLSTANPPPPWRPEPVSRRCSQENSQYRLRVENPSGYASSDCLGREAAAAAEAPSDAPKAPRGIELLQFVQLLLCRDNFAVDPAKLEEADDELSHPMSAYWVASSHNSYLQDADQLAGRSSTDQYRRLLLSGCRSVEIDCWDGDDGEPIVTHGDSAAPLELLPFCVCVWVMRPHAACLPRRCRPHALHEDQL